MNDWQGWLDRLCNLRRDKRGTHERPPKPALLLSIMDLMDRDVIRTNAVPMSQELVDTFKRYYSLVRQVDDKPTIENPFYFLSGDGFWRVIPQGGGEPIYREGFASAAPSVAHIRRQGAIGQFDEGLWALLIDPIARHQLREVLISRYFPDRRDQLAAIAVQCRPSPAPDSLKEEFLPGRDAAFRRVILEVYDYRCAACGMRVLLDHCMSLVEAAHLIPFAVSSNDKPTNGVALCPNHHWAMDRHLIAPCPDGDHPAGVWRFSEDRLDDRIEGQRDLVALNHRPVIPPSERKFYPAIESLRWRETQLRPAM